MIKNTFTHQVKLETISCMTLSHPDNHTLPQFIFLHGAGTGIKEGVESIAESILHNGMNILALDFSGHGESSGELAKSSLKKRVEEANAIINQYASKGPLVICGASMGGYIALHLLKFHEIETLILMCPALYDKKAYDVPFDSGFTEIIRTPQSWMHTDVVEKLEMFTGKLLIIIGEEDAVIPPGVITLIYETSVKAAKKEIYSIPGCPHKILVWVNEHPEKKQLLENKIGEYLK